ncbi:hypothetical protein CCUS01_09628 [Colletotrichum cuscutae]|uniref:Uncharacterized protein n=1 Tax=Colletotrichum cuscutae TaxID=1209917 RepID=A0AAI9UGG6_9PEZI|nr:hypothetical protein CCUS01_09628 [Colletotrichum cuscutae]
MTKAANAINDSTDQTGPEVVPKTKQHALDAAYSYLASNLNSKKCRRAHQDWMQRRLQRRCEELSFQESSGLLSLHFLRVKVRTDVANGACHSKGNWKVRTASTHLPYFGHNNWNSQRVPFR